MILYCFHNNNPINFTIIKNLQTIDIKFAFRSMIDRSGFDRSDWSFNRIVWPLASSVLTCNYSLSHYSDVIVSAMASQITGAAIVDSTALFRRRSYETSKRLVTGLCEGIHQWPVNSPHKGSVTMLAQKMFPFDDVIMNEVFSCDQAAIWTPLFVRLSPSVCHTFLTMFLSWPW